MRISDWSSDVCSSDLASAHAGQIDREAFPDPMHAHRHQVVHQVVLVRHRREHAGNAATLVAGRNLLIAEMRGISVGRFFLVFALLGTPYFQRSFLPQPDTFATRTLLLRFLPPFVFLSPLSSFYLYLFF